MVVAMIAMRVMQAALDEIVDMIAVRRRFMSAAGSMHMARLMAFVPVLGGAAVRIAVADFDHMLVDALAVQTMQMSVMQIVDVVAMLHRNVTASGAVMMRVFGGRQMMMVGH